mmetsp:Transcript_9531/g.10512  ORF Transcript_9531/g.10512 Transcript_9531/m.10512 type:complete len:317 (+) Transcript_9531:106-1056(+)
MELLRRQRSSSLEKLYGSEDEFVSSPSLSGSFSLSYTEEELLMFSSPSNNGNGTNTNNNAHHLHTIEQGEQTISSSSPNDKRMKRYNGLGIEAPSPSSVDIYKAEMRKRRKTGGRSQLCRYTVDKLQGIMLPERLSSYIPISTTDELNQEVNQTLYPRGRIPLFSGLSKVTKGTKPASEAVALCGFKPHRFVWFIMSGFICDVIQFGIDIALFHLLHIQGSSLCWLLGFSLSIIVRHTSHRYLVFGNYVGGYCHSLMKMYAGYSIILVLSTLFNLVLTHLVRMQHYTAWIITLIWTNIVNYFLLKQLWSMNWSDRE